MKDEGRSPKTIRNHHAIISSALHQAVRWGWVRENVAEKAKPPRVSQRRVTAPSVEAVRTVIEAAEERDPRLAPLLMLAALTGMRRGELCALRWTDVDLERGELDVSRSVVVVPGGLAEKTTKTDRSRTVALDDVGVALLTRHRAKVDEWAQQAEVSCHRRCLCLLPRRRRVEAVPARQRHRLLHPGPRLARTARRPAARPAPLHRHPAHRCRRRRAHRRRPAWSLRSVRHAARVLATPSKSGTGRRPTSWAGSWSPGSA